jgi:hypothetical protein
VACRDLYAKRMPPQEPPCDKCRVELLEENEEVVRIYMMTRRQIVTRHNGQYDQIVDISIPAVKVVMDLEGVKDQKECLARVMRLFHHIENERRNDAG